MARDLAAAGRAKPGSVALVCALPRAIGTDALSPIDGLTAAGDAWTAPFYFVRGDGRTAAAEPALQGYRESVLRFPIQFGILGRVGEELKGGLSESYM